MANIAEWVYIAEGAKVVRELTQEEIKSIQINADEYSEEARKCI